MIQYVSGGKESFAGKRVAVSGSGNVAQYAALKAIELGATIISLSDSKGSIIATEEKGITVEDIAFIAQLKVDRKQLTELVNSESHKDKFKYLDGERPWVHVGKVDIALPSATQNEVSKEEAEKLIEAGAKFIAEGSNMGCSQEAIEVFENHRRSKKGEAIWYAPGKLCLSCPLPPHGISSVYSGFANYHGLHLLIYMHRCRCRNVYFYSSQSLSPLLASPYISLHYVIHFSRKPH